MAKLFDLAFAQINVQLRYKFPWLRHAYGKAQTIVNATGTGPKRFPAIYAGGSGEHYKSMAPDCADRVFSFFIISDPQKVDNAPGRGANITARVSQVIWFNYHDMPGDMQSIEDIKAEFISFYTKQLRVDFDLTLTEIHETAAAIYREYSIREFKDQYLMRPYGGLRLDFILKIKEPC